MLSKSLETTATTSVTGVKKYVLNATNADLVNMNTFKDVTINGVLVNNHCSPTVGVNLIKYWANRRGVTGLWNHSDVWVFSSLCVNMKTAFYEGGTTDVNFYNGLMNYSTNTRGISYSGSELCEPTFAKAESIINANVPFNLSLMDHSMACFGYDTTNGERLIVNTGWDSYWTFQLYSTFDIDHYIYVRWN